MLSAIFVDRPRLAIVIAIVTTIAGAWRCYSIPIAQYPDIVPPQVSVTTSLSRRVSRRRRRHDRSADRSPGRRRRQDDLHEERQRQRRQLLAHASFELGTDPDINTVNVNNRVQIALSSLPEEVQPPGRHGQEEIVRVARRDRALFAEADARSAVHLELRHDQPPRPDQEHARRGRCDAVGPAGLRDARLGQDRPPDRPRSHHRRCHQCDPGPERPGRGRPHRRPADIRRPAAAAQRPDQGTAHQRSPSSRTSSIRTNPDGSVLRLRRHRPPGTWAPQISIGRRD